MDLNIKPIYFLDYNFSRREFKNFRTRKWKVLTLTLWITVRIKVWKHAPKKGGERDLRRA